MTKGDLVRISDSGRRQLDYPPKGFGCILRVVSSSKSSGDIVYVLWYDTALTKPINTRWLTKI